jgi:hypothetical protein
MIGLRGTMTEFTERDGGETPVYGENGADVAKAKAMILHLLRAESEAQAARRMRRLCSTVVEREWIEPAFLAVQECRDLRVLGFLEATYLLDTLYRLGRGHYARTGTGRMTAKEAFMYARGEDGAATLLRWRPTEYDWRCSSGALLIMGRRAVPELWGDEEPDPRAVSAISERLAAFAGSESPQDRKAAVGAVESAIWRHHPIDAIAAIQSMREVGMITFAQSLAFSFKAVRRQMRDAVAADRENARCFFERRDPEGTVSERRADLLLAAIYRRVGEHRAANMLRETPGEFDRLIDSAWATPLTRHARAAEGAVRDVPIVGMLQSTAVRRAKGDILRVLHARSTTAAKRHLSALTERVVSAEAEAAAAVTAVQELHDIDLIHVTEFHYLLDRLAIAQATGDATRETADQDERARAADFLHSRGEQAMAKMLRGASAPHEFLCTTGCKTLMETRPAPDRHLRGASDPAAVARIATRLAAWASSECDESGVHDWTGPEWDAVVSVATGETAASGVAAANELVQAGTLSIADGDWAIEGLLTLHVARALGADRVMSRAAHSFATMHMAREAKDPVRRIEIKDAMQRLRDETEARQDRLKAAALRRFGQHIAASGWVEDVGKRGY